MYALRELLLGLLVIHVAWLWFYLCGSLLRVRLAASEVVAGYTHEEALLEIVVRTAIGIALTGFATFALGLAGLLYPFAFVLLVVAAFATFTMLGDSPLRRRFWQTRLAQCRAAVSAGSTILYAAALVLAASAILPDTGSDATAYYYTYAFEWARAHFIFADDWLRLPYYADNWILLYTWFYVLGVDRFVAFLPWLSGTLSLLAIYGTVLRLTSGAAFERPDLRLVRAVTSVIAPAALLLSPTFLHWANIGMVDTSIGLFYFVAAICAISIVMRAPQPYLRDLVVCGGFLVGMKSSLLALIPLLVACVAIGCRTARLSTRATIGTVALFLVLCSPWYVRNFVLAGDPIAPYLNLAIQGVDKLDTVQDMRLLMGDLATDRSPGALARLPLDIVVDTQSARFREPGVTWLLLLLPLPGFVLAYGLFKGRRDRLTPTFVACAFAVYAIAYWCATAYYARYALMFYALLAAVAASLILMLVARIPRVRWAAPVLVAALAVPSPGSAAWLYQHWYSTNGTEFFVYRDREVWLEQSADIRAIRYAGRSLRARGKTNPNVYRTYLESYSLFFREEGLVPIGDWVGPERYRDFLDAVRNDRLRPYVQRLGIDALLVQTPKHNFEFFQTTRYWSVDDQALLDREAAALHMTKEIVEGGDYALYVGN